MSKSFGVEPYVVSYSGRVREELKVLLTRAMKRGAGQQFLDAAKEIDYRLRIYPQFGEPLCDVPAIKAKLLIATVPPLAVRYIVDEETRRVFVVVPLQALPNSGV